MAMNMYQRVEGAIGEMSRDKKDKLAIA